MRWQLNKAVPVAVSALVVGCGYSSDPVELPPADLEMADELDQSAVTLYPCPSNLSPYSEVCASQGGVSTSTWRVGAGAERLTEVAQTFKTSRTEPPGKVGVALRLLREVTATDNPQVRVSIRPMNAQGTTSINPAHDLAWAEIDASSITTGTNVLYEFQLEQANYEALNYLTANTQYAVVVTSDYPDLGIVSVGVQTLPTKPGPYANGKLEKRTAWTVCDPAAYGGGTKGASYCSSVMNKPFYDSGTNEDANFYVTVGDGVCPDDTVVAGGASCTTPTDLGTLATVGSTGSASGRVPGPDVSDWLSVTFPNGTAFQNVGYPGNASISFATNPDSGYRFEVLNPSCGTGAFSGNGGGSCGSSLTSFTFNDTCTVGQTNCNSRVGTTGWPGQMFVRVFRTASLPYGCKNYTLSVSR